MQQTDNARRTIWGRIGEAALKVLGLFVILEPIWMLLPFAGFLYGSVLQMQALGRNPDTAWLTHFVFPVLTVGLVGPALVVLALLLFVVGAVQIYVAKLRRSGLVSSGLYRFVRHPQYVSLTLLGLGLLLTWGRAIAYLAFFFMLFLYYHLSKLEERNCRRIFGEEYEEYRKRTSFLFPGDRLLRPLAARVSLRAIPAPVRFVLGLALTVGLCFGSMWLVNALKLANRTVPHMTAVVEFAEAPVAGATDPDIRADWSGSVQFVWSDRVAVVRGPYRNAVAPGFAERVLLRTRESAALMPFLGFLDRDEGGVAVVFCVPYGTRGGSGAATGPGRFEESGRRGPAPDPHGTDKVTLICYRVDPTPGATFQEILGDRSARRLRGACFAPVDLARPRSEDFVDGDLFTPGPGFPAETPWGHAMDQIASQTAAPDRGPEEAVIPGRHGEGRLILVQAPILRTRLDPGFARDILDRLVSSERFIRHLGSVGVGGDLVAVAFPRPGPNWYREHRGRPQVSLFVMLVRNPAGESVELLFEAEAPRILGAFTAEMDFRIDDPADSVDEISIIGRRRDLTERWVFFLSGI